MQIIRPGFLGSGGKSLAHPGHRDRFVVVAVVVIVVLNLDSFSQHQPNKFYSNYCSFFVSPAVWKWPKNLAAGVCWGGEEWTLVVCIQEDGRLPQGGCRWLPMWEKWQWDKDITFIFGWSKCSVSSTVADKTWRHWTWTIWILDWYKLSMEDLALPVSHPSRQWRHPVTVAARTIEWCLDVMTPPLNPDYPGARDISSSTPPRVLSCSRLWPSGGYCRTGAPMSSVITLAAAPSPRSCHLELAAQHRDATVPRFRV